MNDECTSKTYICTKYLNIQLKHINSYITIFNDYLPNKNSGFVKKTNVSYDR